MPSHVAELDSFGHDVGELKEEARRRRMADRAGRHRRRREKRGVGPPEPEGMSTDDEEMEGDRQRTTLELGKWTSLCLSLCKCLRLLLHTVYTSRSHGVL